MYKVGEKFGEAGKPGTGELGENMKAFGAARFMNPSFLLLKTALSQQGRMSNVGAQDVYDEILRNEVRR